MSDEYVDPFARESGLPEGLPVAPEPTEAQLSPEEGEWYQPYPERPRLQVLPQARWLHDLPKAHAQRWGEARFYVQSETGMVGLVPWPGSHVVWPWEAGWLPDTRKIVADAKPERKK